MGKLQAIHAALGTIVPFDAYNTWLRDVKAVHLQLRKMELADASGALDEILGHMDDGPFRDKYCDFQNQIADRMRAVTFSDLKAKHGELSEAFECLRECQSNAHQKLVLNFTLLSLFVHGAPDSLKHHASDMPIVSSNAKNEAATRCLVVTGNTVRYSDAGTSCTISGPLKADLLKSIKCYPRTYLLCKLTDTSAPIGRNHQSKAFSALFDHRPYRLADLIKSSR